MEVMQWEALSKSARKRCENTNTGSCWLAPDIKEGRNDEDDIRTLFAKEKAPRNAQKHGAFLVVSSYYVYYVTPASPAVYGLIRSVSYPFLPPGISFQILEKLSVCGKNQGTFLIQSLSIDFQGFHK